MLLCVQLSVCWCLFFTALANIALRFLWYVEPFFFEFWLVPCSNLLCWWIHVFVYVFAFVSVRVFTHKNKHGLLILLLAWYIFLCVVSHVFTLPLRASTCYHVYFECNTELRGGCSGCTESLVGLLKKLQSLVYYCPSPISYRTQVTSFLLFLS